MRPQLSGRKCVGAVEAHQNGLRFMSTKAEVLDVMYSNIKHAIFQPCDRTTMVLVHFHLKDHILIGKKKQKDVQFFTEGIESSLNLDGGRRSAYDPDELDEEQREREMRKKLNLAFREFFSKVEKVAAHYDFKLEIDVVFRKLGFNVTWSREMVLMQPTTHCLVSLTEWPPFVLTLSEVEHVHFERVTYATKAFDLIFIFKNWDIPPRAVNAIIDIKFMDIVQDWLNEVEITFSKGPKALNWADVMKALQADKATFYDDKDADGISKPAGWLFLSEDASDEEGEEEENEDSSFAESGDEESGDNSDSDDSDDSDDEDASEEEDDDEDEEDEEELEEKGKSWEELENDAKAADKMKRPSAEELEDMQAKKKKPRR
mmetsp:Transcript_3992/g.5577  ORF Transcript_3992/g.5577 Transcript_3992/m.5577 type:complete len:374 (+) Transcript_3992:1306-2427(+)